MSKRFALWRLPPVLIVHLKRFQFDRTSRRKLTNKVDFPLEGLDLTRYLAPTRWDHLKTENTDLKSQNGESHGDESEDENQADREFERTYGTINGIHDDKNGCSSDSSSHDVHTKGKAPTAAVLPNGVSYPLSTSQHDKNTHSKQHSQGKGSYSDEMDSHSLENTTDNSSSDSPAQNNSNSSSGSNSSSESRVALTMKGTDGSLYDLYSVVHHVGAMGGGHYVTTTRDRERGTTVEDARKIARQLTRSASPSVYGAVIPTSHVEEEAISQLNATTGGNTEDSDVAGKDGKEGVKKVSKDAEKGVEKRAGKGAARGSVGLDGTAAPPPGGQWWCYNDDVVTEVSDPREVTSASAYVLFYMRRDVWGMDVKEIFEESRRNSMGVMLSSKDNTGTLTGSTSRTPDIRAPMPQKGASDAPKGYWRPRLPAVVGRHHGPGPSSSAVSVNSSASVTPNISTKTRILAPMNGREGTGVPPLSARLSLKMLGQRHANFSGNAGDDESSSESSSTSGREKEKGGGHNDSDKCILS
jgi:Ubiquitin carboxyl-terminal hydrolase